GFFKFLTELLCSSLSSSNFFSERKLSFLLDTLTHFETNELSYSSSCCFKNVSNFFVVVNYVHLTLKHNFVQVFLNRTYHHLFNDVCWFARFKRFRFSNFFLFRDQISWNLFSIYGNRIECSNVHCQAFTSIRITCARYNNTDTQTVFINSQFFAFKD